MDIHKYGGDFLDEIENNLEGEGSSHFEMKTCDQQIRQW